MLNYAPEMGLRGYLEPVLAPDIFVLYIGRCFCFVLIECNLTHPGGCFSDVVPINIG